MSFSNDNTWTLYDYEGVDLMGFVALHCYIDKKKKKVCVRMPITCILNSG